MNNIYEKLQDDEINKLLEDIPEEKWFRHEELIREGLKRYFKLYIRKDLDKDVEKQKWKIFRVITDMGEGTEW